MKVKAFCLKTVNMRKYTEGGISVWTKLFTIILLTVLPSAKSVQEKNLLEVSCFFEKIYDFFKKTRCLLKKNINARISSEAKNSQ